MFSLEMEPDDAVKDILVAELWEQGSIGITETELPDGRWKLVAFFDPEADADLLILRFAAHGPRLATHPPRDWVADARATWEPLSVGDRFYLVPDWRDDPTPPGRFRIAINPGLACGTGYHEATQLCLEAIEQYANSRTTALDVGCGAGILSIAAALIGASRVIACDVDPVAVGIAAAAFESASVRALLFVGSAGCVRSGSAGLILANISAAAAIELAPELLRCLSPEGRCVVSGFETHESAGVETALLDAGGFVERSSAKGQWRALVVIRKAHPNTGLGDVPPLLIV
jgi:ribosomal protein L11 methyltransferase